MARIRSIHPGIMSDEAFMTLTVEEPTAIPLLLGLWMEADDDGIFEWKPLTLKAKTLPAVNVEVGRLLSILCSLNFIREFEVEGKRFGAIRNFKLWQRPKLPKVKWPKGEGIAAYVGETSERLPKCFPSDTETSPQRKEGGGRKEEEVKDTPIVVSSSAKTEKKTKAKKGSRISEDWSVTDKGIQHALSKGLSMSELQLQAERFKDHWLSASGDKATKMDWEATWRTWIGNYLERQQTRRGSNLVSLPKPKSEFMQKQDAITRNLEREAYGEQYDNDFGSSFTLSSSEYSYR